MPVIITFFIVPKSIDFIELIASIDFCRCGERERERNTVCSCVQESKRRETEREEMMAKLQLFNISILEASDMTYHSQLFVFLDSDTRQSLSKLKVCVSHKNVTFDGEKYDRN